MTTVTISVSKNGASRSVTLLASRVIFWEVATTIAVFVGGFFIGKLF